MTRKVEVNDRARGYSSSTNDDFFAFSETNGLSEPGKTFPIVHSSCSWKKRRCVPRFAENLDFSREKIREDFVALYAS